MAELGAHSDAAHAEAGRAAAGLGIDTLVTVGERAQRTAAAARAAGLHRVLELGTVAEAAAALPELVRAGDVVLLKASRSTGLERATEALVQRLMECKK
jgi:UDP-N-acetylmuramoyl-tripeptide--D-alanyl-D-alanine ligase